MSTANFSPTSFLELDDVNPTGWANGHMPIWNGTEFTRLATNGFGRVILSKTTDTEVRSYIGAQAALGFTPENVGNKATDFATVNHSLYPTVQAVKTYADTLVVGLLDDRGSHNASGNVFPSTGGSGTAGALLKGDLWFISVAGTLGGVAVNVGDQVRALADTPGQTAGSWAISEANVGFVPENSANKSSNASLGSSNTLYPTQAAVKTYVDATVANGFVPVSRTVNGHPLSIDVVVSPGDLSLEIGEDVQAWSGNLDGWSTRMPYLGQVAVNTGKTLTVSNILTFAGTDGSHLNIGAGGNLGSAAYAQASNFQPSDGHLTAIAALSTHAFGRGLLTQGSESAVRSYIGAATALGFTPENGANKAIDFSTVNHTLYPSVQAVKTYADALVVGLLDDRGNFDASGNVFPASGGSGTAGAILKGDIWFISVAGTLGGVAVTIGDQVRALVDSPGQTAGNWGISEANIGFVPEVPLTFSTGLTRTVNTITVNAIQSLTRLSNLTSNGFIKTGSDDGTLSIDTADYLPTTYLDTDDTLAADSDTKIPSQKAIKTYVDAAVAGGGGNVSVIPDEADTFTYVSDGDANGIVYFIGTNFGAESWANPHTAGRVTVTRSSDAGDGPEVIVDRDATGDGHTNDVANSWVAVDLGATRSAVLNKYTMRGRVAYADVLRNWKLQGSNDSAGNSVAELDAATWTDIDSRVNDTTMPVASGGAFGTYDISGTPAAYRWFRVLQNGVNSSGSDYNFVSEIELYGSLVLEPGFSSIDGELALFSGTGGQTLKRGPVLLTGSAALNFPSTAAGNSSDLTLAVLGATVEDVVMLGVHPAAILPNSNYTAWVSDDDEVTVRFTNAQLSGAQDPDSGQFNATVLHY